MLSCWTAVENLDFSASEEGFSAERLGESEKERKQERKKKKETKRKEKKRKKKGRKQENQRKKDRQKERKTQRKKGGTQSKASTNTRLSTWLLWAIIRLPNLWSSLFQRPWKQHSIKEPMTNKSVLLRLSGTTKMLHRPSTWFSWQRRKVRSESGRPVQLWTQFWRLSSSKWRSVMYM